MIRSLTLAGLLLGATSFLPAAEKPNFVFFLVDDLGWADIGCFGSTFHETPNIDALAASGMKFTNAYAAASICSPTRASILTGRHPVRVNITDWIPGAKTPKGRRFLHVDDRDNLALEEVTIAEVLKEAGYATFFAGKWHLGHEGHWPTDQGFDINIGGHHAGSPPGGYYSPWKNPALDARHDGEYVTERLSEESIAFMKEKKDAPFLLYLSYYNVHTPIQPYKKRINHYVEEAGKLFKDKVEPIAEHDAFSRSRQDNPEFASMVQAVDDSVGAILKSLEDLEISDNTIVIFFSDNGGLCTKSRPGPTCNLPLRSGKGWLYEGGIREPAIVRAPGVTEAGSVCESPVVSMDFFPTMLELAGLESRPELHADGQSVVSLLKGESPTGPRQLAWHYPHYHGSTWAPGAAIRIGDWKLIDFWEDDSMELYNLAEDIGEQNDLSSEKPEKLAELSKKLGRVAIEDECDDSEAKSGLEKTELRSALMPYIAQPVPELPVNDLDRAAQYYCDTLGFTRQWAFPDIVSIAREDVAIFFRLTEERVVPQTHWIYTDDVDATFAEMEKAGAEIVEPIAEKPWGLRQFTIRDPDGHRFHIHHNVDRTKDGVT